MEQERIEAFANQIKEKNSYNKLIQTISFYAMILGWITYCVVNDYTNIWARQGLIPTGLVLLYVINLWMYCMNFVNGYTKVEGKGGKSVQDIWECVNPMPFAFDDYMKYIQKKFVTTMIGIGTLHIVSAIVGMFVSARVNEETDQMEYIWLLPDKAGSAFAFCVVISVLFLIAMYTFFYIQKYRVMKVANLENNNGKKQSNRPLLYMQMMFLILGIVITLLVLFVGLFQYDTDPFLTICFMLLLLVLLPLRYWYITLLVIVLVLIFAVRSAKKRKQLKEHPELVKTSRSRMIGKHVIGLGVLQVGILLVIPFIYNIYAEENVAGYSTTDWLEYGYFDGHYEGEDYDRYTGLFVFPDKISPNAENVEYYYAARPGFLDSSYDK